ncbi:MAG: hydroxymethylbilane synthase [Planctomycetota bacterium]|nr:hydroxymethylbilane synthase [Planctomycetota bacterium]MDW8373415.1 hydroxymethylbilane synthase [Planctomycetota bacterium]
MRVLRLATRASPLALWQARVVARALRRAHPAVRVQLVPVTSHGDRDQQTPLAAMPVIGAFCKEVHAAIREGRADAGVHSCKDLPTRHPPDLVLAAVLPRADPRDVLFGTAGLAALPSGAVIATGSPRRRAQLAALRPDLRFVELRGNIHTRLQKIARGAADAACLALAGLRRLGLSAPCAAAVLDPWRECAPAPGQGAIAVDCRADDRRTRVLLAAIDDRDTRRAILAERAVLAALGGGCALPLGCLAARQRGRWRLIARHAAAAGLREALVEAPYDELVQRAIGQLTACKAQPSGLPGAENHGN